MAASMRKITGIFGQKLPSVFRLSSLYKLSSKADASLEHSEVQYPPIGQVGDERKYVVKMEQIKNAPTVPEMIYLLQKKQCWNYQLKPACFHPNFLPVYTHATKTHLVEGLPDYVNNFIGSDRISQLAASVKASVEEFALQEMIYGYRHHRDGNYYLKDYDKARVFMQNMINHFLLTEIGQCPHILTGEFDHDVEVKSFWEREDTRYQYKGKPSILLRSKEPLLEFTSRDSDLSVGEVAPYPYKPEWYSIFKIHHNSECFPGLKYGNPVNYGHTQLFVTAFDRNKLLDTSRSYHDEVILGNGMMSSFGWMAAMCMYNKHYWDDDLTRPMTCNTIVTDGKNFSFFCYQLNTIALHSRVSETNNVRNVCWYTRDAQLYEELTKEGEVINFNMDVLKTIIGMLMMSPGNNMLQGIPSDQKKLDQDS